MSKTSKNSLPTSYSTSLNVNGNNKASVKMDGTNAALSFTMSPDEQKAYEYAQNSFAQNMPSVNVFSANTLASLNNQVEAFKNSGIKNINDIYNPIMKNMQNDIASRFGNFNNSVFMDNLNKIESKRAESISDLAQDVATKEQDLVNNELANRYNYLNFLNDYQNQVLSDMYNALGLANSAQNSSYNYLTKAAATNNSGSRVYSNNLSNSTSAYIQSLLKNLY